MTTLPYQLVLQTPRLLTRSLLPQEVGKGWLLQNVVKMLRRKLGTGLATPGTLSAILGYISMRPA